MHTISESNLESVTSAERFDAPPLRFVSAAIVFGVLALGSTVIVVTTALQVERSIENRVREDSLRWTRQLARHVDPASPTQSANALLAEFAHSLNDIERIYTLSLTNESLANESSNNAAQASRIAVRTYDTGVLPTDRDDPVSIDGQRALAEGIELVSAPHPGISGEIVSVFAPFYDSDGRLAGVAGIDWPTSTLSAPVRAVRTAATIGLVLSLSFSAAVAWLYSRRMRRTRAEFEAYRTHIRELEIERASSKRTLTKTNSFMATMSHEVRTPLTAILGFTDLLLYPGNETSVLRAHAHTIRRSGQHLMSVVDDILDLSKIESGMMRIEREPCDVREVVQDVVDVLAPRAGEKQITLGCVLDSDVPRGVFCDALRLRQILLNLCSNAVKFTESGHVQVRVQRTPDGSELAFEVSDTGIGIDPRHLKHLFQPFQQADRSIARRFGGTGLGLAISKRLALALGGDIVAESRLGQGSMFRLTIPAEVAELPRRTTASIPPIEVLGAWPPHPSWRILVIEDELEHQKLLFAMLRRSGHSVEVCDTGARAVLKIRETKYRGEPFTLVILDIYLRRQDGLATARQMRVLDYRGPILALTADTSSSMRASCLESGCDEVLTKPIDRAALFGAMNRLIRDQPVLGSASGETPRAS